MANHFEFHLVHRLQGLAWRCMALMRLAVTQFEVSRQVLGQRAEAPLLLQDCCRIVETLSRHSFLHRIRLPVAGRARDNFVLEYIPIRCRKRLQIDTVHGRSCAACVARSCSRCLIASIALMKLKAARLAGPYTSTTR